MLARKSIWLVGLTLAAASGVFAQTASIVRPNSWELGGFVGGSYGVDDAHYIGGVNLTYAVTRRILPYTEFSYFPGIGRSITKTFPGSTDTFSYVQSVPFADFHGGVHIRLPIKEKPIVPYLVIGVGGLHHFARDVKISVPIQGSQPIQLTVPVPGGTDFAVNFGGGIRYYFNQKFGMRLEAKAYKSAGDFSDVFGKVEVGFFYQFR